MRSVTTTEWPGSRLRFVEFAERFSVSQSVVREALTRLAEQGLAVALPQQGFRVRPLTLADLDELTHRYLLAGYQNDPDGARSAPSRHCGRLAASGGLSPLSASRP